jgi:hypothetical protein
MKQYGGGEWWPLRTVWPLHSDYNLGSRGFSRAARYRGEVGKIQRAGTLRPERKVTGDLRRS